jgi:hypothetical protein
MYLLTQNYTFCVIVRIIGSAEVALRLTPVTETWLFPEQYTKATSLLLYLTKL